MRPCAPKKRQHEAEHQQDGHQLEEPEQAALQLSDHDIHADMRALALHIGDAHDGDQRHQGFDVIDIAQKRAVHQPDAVQKRCKKGLVELAPGDGIGREEHQRKRREAADQGREFLDR